MATNADQCQNQVWEIAAGQGAEAGISRNALTLVSDMSAGMVTVDAGMSKFSGVVQCDTLITNSVVSSSYTPGAGNIW